MSSRFITVLGGGLSGLSAVFHLARRFPARSGIRIALVESSQRLGGWVQSEKVRVQDGAGHEADVVLESGPRTLRPVSKAVLELVHLLALKSSVLTVPRTAPAARNRFVHLPGQDGLAVIPGSFLALLRSPLAKILVPAVLKDARLFSGTVLNTSTPNDESVDAFLTRHFGADFAQTFGSALVHGIYAADSRVLSVRSAFSALCQLEESGKGSVTRGAVSEMLSSWERDIRGSADAGPYELGNIPELLKGTSVFSFQDGMQSLTDTVVARLAALPHVDIVKGDGVMELSKATDGGGFEVTTKSGKRLPSSHIVSAIPLPHLHRLLSTPNHPQSGLAPLPHLTVNPSSSVTVVNLVFPPTADPIHPEGFGYLIPRPSTDYPSSSLGMLGTVFDSCALPSQDKPISPSPSPFRFTKLTVMLGGPYGPSTPAPSSPSFLPALLETLRRHLGRADPLPEPCLVRVREHKECIPTPTVGHAARMAELATAVREHWGANVAVIGAGVGGVSVGDCVEGGRRAAYNLEL
ncbi:Protoporphyrinogen oxidase [Dichomitus squalens]|uniref:Protoporphyrinogen oxidase n=1 Tax=Dichomitus squalens TaxID=114155 RepID=A0A4Q9MNU3_9APHY|nr:Protoporphyrinogen oxidase [Dichomitus squalens]